MKKLVILMSAVATLAMAACGSSDEKNNPNPQPQPGPEQVSDGVYTPGAQIATAEKDGTSETWQWEDGMLQSIVAETDGNSINEYTFAYNADKQLSQMSMTIQQMPVKVKYNYTGRKLTSFSATSGALRLLDGTVGHDANGCISTVDIELDSTMAGYISSMIGNMIGGGGFPSMGDMAAAKGMPTGKMAIDKYTMHYDISWQGENIASYVSAMSFQMIFTVEELKSLPLFDSLLGSYMDLVDMFVPAGSTVPIAMTMTDTNELTYDSHPNPLQGLLRDLEPTALSANNIQTTHTSSGMTIHINLGFLAPFQLPNGEESHGYNYQYNASGYPTEVSIDGQHAITYTYQQ